MKKNRLLPFLIVLSVIACTIFMRDGLIYLVTALMLLAISGTIMRKKSWVLKMTRWGKAHPRKAQVFITIIQVFLMMFGLIAGYNYKKLGIEFTDTTAFVFCTIIVTGFLSVPFLPKRRTIAIPSEVNKVRMIFICIALSSFVMMMMTGNRIGEKYPNSFLTHSLEKIDQAIFPDFSTEYADLNEYKNYVQPLAFASLASYEVKAIDPEVYSNKESRDKLKAEKKVKKLEKKKAKMIRRFERQALAAGMSAGSILLIILLVITTCAGICMIISGFGAHWVLFPAGAAVAAASIWGIIKIIKKNKRKPEQ